MNKKKYIGITLKALIILVGICIAVTGFYLVPRLGQLIFRYIYSWMEPWYRPWLIVISIAEVICATCLIPAWKISSRIGHGRPFCRENVRDLKKISLLLLIDSVYFIIGIIVMRIVGMNFRTSALLMIIVFFAGIVLSVFSYGLAILVAKGTDIKDENDLTV